MPRRSKNKFEVVNGDIHITKEDWPVVGLTTYRDDYFEELTSKRGRLQKVLYDAVRGVWRASKERVKTIEYVFGVYNSLIVAVYKPSEWFVCKEAKDKLPRQDIVLTPKTERQG